MKRQVMRSASPAVSFCVENDSGACGNLESALRSFAAFAVFLNWYTCQFRQERCRESTDFGMPWHCRGQGAAITANGVCAIFLFKLGHAAHFVQDFDGGFQAHAQVSG